MLSNGLAQQRRARLSSVNELVYRWREHILKEWGAYICPISLCPRIV